MYAQLHNDFRWFNQSTRRNHRVAPLIKLDATQHARTTVPVAQVKFIMLVASYQGYTELVLGATGSTTSIQYFYPLQYLRHVAIVRTCITNDPSAQCSRYPRSKLQSSPAKRR